MSATKAGKICVFLLAFTLLLSVSGCGKKNSGLSGEGDMMSSEYLAAKETTYKTKKLISEELVRTLELDADPSYVFSKSVTSGSKESVLSELCVTRNQHVKKGDVLAVLSGKGNESDVRELELQIEYFKASSEENKEKLASLVEEAAMAETDNAYDEEIRQLKVKKAQAAYDAYVLSSEYTLKNMIAQLEKTEKELKETYIYSPIDGIIKTVASGYKPGDVVKENSILCVVNYTGAVLFYASSTSGAYAYNREVTLKVGRGEKEVTVNGRVVSSPEVMPEETFAGGIFVEVNPEDLTYGPNHAVMSIKYIMMKDTLIIDKSAAETEEGLDYVLLLDGNTVKKRYIIRGPGTGLMVSAVQGLKVGDEVILSSYNAN